MSQEIKEGKWVFVPLEKWERPENVQNYDMKLCQISLRMFNADDEDRELCLRERILPPKKLSPQQLKAWCAGARAVLEKMAITNLTQN